MIFNYDPILGLQYYSRDLEFISIILKPPYLTQTVSEALNLMKNKGVVIINNNQQPYIELLSLPIFHNIFELNKDNKSF